MDRRVIFDKDTPLRKTNYLGPSSVPELNPTDIIPGQLLRDALPLPSLGELDVVRHYANLAQLNFSVDTNFYPLGSCTMKYNPKINEELAALAGFTDIHPYQDEAATQGALELMHELEGLLCGITGMRRFTLQPSSGAQGELCGMLMIRKYHQARGNKKTKVIVPDSAHGTNPATASMCGYQTVVVESDSGGLLDLDKLRAACDVDTAALMFTNPNTLGLFEERISEIADIVHSKGGLLYYDGANLNALLGITTPALMGFDLVHLNLHKTFSTPHGCGGPGSGVVGVNEALVDFLPVPLVESGPGRYHLNYDLECSIGRLRAFYGNFSVLVKAYTYLLRLGLEGLIRAAGNATINANYIKEKLKPYYRVAYDRTCMHEVVFSCLAQKERGASALDIAKRLIDYGLHPPTMYFPLIVKEALMVEPTETESKDTLDAFIQAMIAINHEIDMDLEKLKTAPHTTCTRRVDEVQAARQPDLRWKKTGA